MWCHTPKPIRTLQAGKIPACAFPVTEINDNGCNSVKQLQRRNCLLESRYTPVETQNFSSRLGRLTCKRSQIRVLSRPLVVNLAESITSDACRRSVVRRFPRAKNGSYRFCAVSHWETRTMSRSSTHLPKYRKHRSTGQAVVSISGRDFYLGPRGTKVSPPRYCLISSVSGT
jgi:hypothetical protein